MNKYSNFQRNFWGATLRGAGLGINQLNKNKKMYKTSHMSLYSFTENEVLLKKEEVLSKLERLNYLEGLIKSDSVNRVLRNADKRPSQSGVDDCDDRDYEDLYEISKGLRIK